MGGNSQFDSSTRQIVLTPSLNNTPPNPSTPTSTSVAIRNNQKSGGNDLPFSSTPQPSAQFQMPVAVIVNQASDASGNQISQRLSVSEPFQPYPTPNALSPTYPDGTQIAYQTPYDDPLDGFVPTVGSQNARQPLPASSSYWNVVLTTGTTLQFRYVHLQRLANPMLPWDSTRNPYRTVDSMVIDLTTFNGVSTATGGADNEGVSPASTATAPMVGVPPPHFFAERGENNLIPGVSNPPPNNPWTQENLGSTTGGHVGATYPTISALSFTAPLNHTLGYLNWFLNKDANGNQITTGPSPGSGTGGTMYMGAPVAWPFPWITWNNRPFVDEMELLLVPALNARELLMNPNALSVANSDGTIPASTAYPFGKTFGVNSGTNPYGVPLVSFPHTMNFFYQPTNIDPTQQTNPRDTMAYFHRLLEYVYVPSKFVNIETSADPNAGVPFNAPFNYIPDYREPGRINANTIFTPDVVTALVNYYPGLNTTALWQKLVETRQGYPATSANNFASLFAQPFRSAGGRWLVPPTSGNQGLAGRTGRREPNVVSAGPRRPGTAALALDKTGVLMNLNYVGNANDPDRSAYFRQNLFEKVGNTLTTRSNVFAVWITIGYFEALPLLQVWPSTNGLPPGLTAQQAAVIYPDGYTLGQELGLDTGTNVRHRGFYIIDRTIPVGFQRGMNNNAANTILKKTYIP